MGVMQVMRSLLMAQPHRESIVGTNGIATFDTDIKGLMKLTVPFGPLQDLHGMPNPYPAGTSVNLIPDGTDTENGYVDGYYLMSDDTTTANANLYVSEFFEVDPTVTYTWSNAYNPTNPSICFYDENKSFISGIASAQQMPITFTPPEGAVYARSSQTKYPYQVSNPTNCYQLEIGSVATAYRRYSNICEIKGYSSAFIAHTGRNLIPKNRTIYGRYPRSNKVTSTSTYKSLFVHVPPNKGLYYKSNKTNCAIYAGMTNGIATSSDVKNTVTMTNRTEWSGTSTDSYVYTMLTFMAATNLSDVYIRDNAIRLNLDSLKAFTEPQDNQYMTVAFTDPTTGDPMTVYCGTLILNEDGSADLVNNALYYDLQGRTWYKMTGAHPYFYTSFGNTHIFTSGDIIAFSAFPATMINISNTSQGAYTVWSSEASHRQRIVVRWDASGADTVEEFKAFIDGLPECYALVESLNPESYHFDNIGQLKSFIGQNNVWTDFNGDPTVGYWKHG